ncbi:MAG: DUF29 family protein [Alphaproteobacteria bacterium]|nr:DUF29 family protein [Alphaproteobacteria bacterium]
MENLAEESKAGSDRQELRSQIRRIFRQLIKLEASPAVDPRTGWRATIRDARAEIAGCWKSVRASTAMSKGRLKKQGVTAVDPDSR